MDIRCKGVPDTWEAFIDKFCDELAARGLSSNTVALRRAHLSQLARGVEVAPIVLARAELVNWLAGRSWSAETRRAWRSSLRSFFTWLGRVELADVTGKVRPAAPSPRPCPEEAVLSAVRRAPVHIRLMIQLAAEAGLRRGELARVHARDLVESGEGCWLRVFGKGGKWREVPISKPLARAIRVQARGGYAFVGQDEGHISPHWAGKLIRRYLPEAFSTHTLRHRFASRAYGESLDIMAVSRLLGHASVATTQRYVATDRSRLRVVAGGARLVA